MGSPKHQHFIPKSYLKYFAAKKDGQFWVDSLLKGENEEIKTLPTTNVCVQKNLYTFPFNSPGERFALEKFYAVEVDAVYPEVYEMLVNPNITVIGKEDKRKILNTILSLFFRTPRFLNYKTGNDDAIFDKIAATVNNPDQEISIGLRKGEEIRFKRKEIDEIRQQRKQKMKENFLIGHFGEWQDFVNYKMECGMEIISTADDVPIITSDNPVVIMDMDGRLNTENVFHHDNIIEVPINRNTYLIIYPNSISENARLRITRANRDRQFSAGVNLSTEKNSDVRLISYPGDLAIHFKKQKELGEWSKENVEAFGSLLNRTAFQMELMALIKSNKTTICQDVADKVREIRKTKMMDGEEIFEKLILALAKNGYLTA